MHHAAHLMTTIPHYEQHAAALVTQYESLAFEDVHASLRDLLPPPGATILDIGAGSGRDAAWPSGQAWNLMPASRPINNQKSNRLVTQGALERVGDIIVNWWDGAFLSNGDDARQRFFMEATQTLPLLIAAPGTTDLLDAMKLHRIRLARDQGLRAWEPVLKASAVGVLQPGVGMK